MAVLLDKVRLTPGAQGFAQENGLEDAVKSVVAIATKELDFREIRLEVTEYDDLSGIQLLRTTIEAGLRGKDAVAAEDRILDRMLDVMDVEVVNKFMILVS